MRKINWNKLIGDYRDNNPETRKTAAEIIREYYFQTQAEKLMDKQLGTKPALLGMKKQRA